MPLFALILSVFYLGGYLIAMRHIAWLELFRPRGGIVGFGIYLTLALGLVVAGKHSSAQPGARFQMTMGGWLLLLMPPLWYFITKSFE